MVMFLILRTQSTQYLHGLFHTRFFHDHRLKPPLQCRIFFDMLTVFLDRSRTDDLDQSTGQRRFHNVGCIQCSFGTTCTDDRMQFIHKQQDIAYLLHFLHNPFDPFLELTTIFCTCYHSGYIQSQDPFFLQMLRYGSCCYPCCQSFHDRGFSHTRFSDQARIIFAPAAQDLDHPLQFVTASDQRIQFSLPGTLRQI